MHVFPFRLNTNFNTCTTPTRGRGVGSKGTASLHCGSNPADGSSRIVGHRVPFLTVSSPNRLSSADSKPAKPYDNACINHNTA